MQKSHVEKIFPQKCQEPSLESPIKGPLKFTIRNLSKEGQLIYPQFWFRSSSLIFQQYIL